MNEMTQNMSAERLLQASGILVAVYENGGFAAAGTKLGLDPSAISHRIRALEADLGFQLFERTTRTMKPTRAGKLICEAAKRARQDLNSALISAINIRSSSTLRISIPSSVAMKWLVPLLPDACEHGLDLSLDVSEEVSSLDHSSADAAIRFGPGPYPGQHAIKLASCWLQPVASPSYVEKLPANTSPLDRDHARFLADRLGETDNTSYCWAAYLQDDNGNHPLPSDLHAFERADLMLQAAIGGLGIALGRTLLVEQDIRQGLLMAIGPPRPSKASYWLVTSHELARSDRIEKLKTWLDKKIKETALTPHSA